VLPKWTINGKAKTISFSSGFFRAHGINPNVVKFFREGYDPDTREIGIEFLQKPDKNGEALKLNFTKAGNAAHGPIRALISTFALKAEDLSGVYEEAAIAGPVDIPGFAGNGFLLKVDLRK
jgi:hypothetical protein